MSLYIDVEQISDNFWRWQLIDEHQINLLTDESCDEFDVVITSGFTLSEEEAHQEAQEQLHYLLSEPLEM